ncbi:MAG: hypothetical protein P4L46_06220 [Fimbriimonas sp.]|nr:hypothetical protein [Fimbriimonas sp.]
MLDPNGEISTAQMAAYVLTPGLSLAVYAASQVGHELRTISIAIFCLLAIAAAVSVRRLASLRNLQLAYVTIAFLRRCAFWVHYRIESLGRSRFLS